MKGSDEKRVYWEKHLTSWEASGLTQIAYCTQAQVAYATFKKWRSQLRAKANIKIPHFVEAKEVVPEKASTNGLILQISLSNGSRIAVSAGASAEVIHQVLALTGAAS